MEYEPDWDVYNEENPDRCLAQLVEEAQNLYGRLAARYREAVSTLQQHTRYSIDLRTYAPHHARVDRLWRLLEKAADRVERREVCRW